MAGAFEIGVWCLLVAASITDILWGKVYNVLTLPSILLGLALQIFLHGSSQFTTSLLAVALGFAIFFPLYFAKIMAAGDVKLLMAIGAWTDPKTLLEMAGISVVLGALVGLGLMLVTRGVLGTLSSLNNHVKPTEKKLSTRMAFAPAFLCAFFILKIAEARGWFVH